MSENFRIIQPYNNKLKYFQLLLIPLFLVGFESISFLVSDIGAQQSNITILYRALFVFICLFVICTSSIKKRIFSQNFTLFIFWILYLFRGLYDSTLNQDAVKEMILMYWLFAFFLAFIPMIAVMSTINKRSLIEAKKVFFCFSNFCQCT